MEPGKYKPGMLVRHPVNGEWGLGKVLEVHDNKVKVHFKDDPKDFRTLTVEKIPLIVVEGESDPALDNLPPFLGDRFDVKAKRVTFDDGVQKFNEKFPRGFQDPAYLGSGKLDKHAGERNYKWEAHKRYKRMLGDGQGEHLLSEGKIDDLAHHACEIVSCELNLFTELAEAVAKLPVEAGKARVATWPVLTILPYLAFPDRFMFLKPEITKECAARLRFNLQYDSDLRWTTYKRLMEMSDFLLERLRPLGASDYIDVQSFMWVIAKY